LISRSAKSALRGFFAVWAFLPPAMSMAVSTGLGQPLSLRQRADVVIAALAR
jgi:hypothetical protein